VETDAPRLKAGQQVSLIFPAYPELQVEGVVVSYPAVGRVATRGATVLDTEIRIDKPPDEILPGYSFTGEILGGPEERVLTVENAAIAYENGVAYAERFVTPEPEIERLPVEVVPYGHNMVRVLSGLEPGDRLKAQAAANALFSGGRRGSGRSSMGLRLF
jgi:hypothetical protein